MTWQPATVEGVIEIIQEDLAECDTEQVAAFRRYGVKPYFSHVLRYGKMESVIVVAQREKETIYWNDVEEGFNLSPVDESGQLLHHGCNQDSLGLALNAWIEGRLRPKQVGPTIQIE